MTDLSDLLLTLTVRLRKAGTAAFVPLGLSWREALFLLYIERGCVRPTDLAKEFGALFPTISGLGAKFVDLGVIKKVQEPGDARGINYVLTRKGHKLCLELKEAWRRSLPPDFTGMSDEEKDALQALCLKISRSDFCR